MTKFMLMRSPFFKFSRLTKMLLMLQIEIAHPINFTGSKQDRKISFADFQVLMKWNTAVVNKVPTMKRFNVLGLLGLLWSEFRSHSYIKALLVSCGQNSEATVCNCLEFMIMANFVFPSVVVLGCDQKTRLAIV